MDQLATLIEAGADPSSKDAAKLQKVIDEAEAGVTKTVDKAMGKAAAKGIATSITAQDVIDAVDELIGAVLDVAEGIE